MAPRRGGGRGGIGGSSSGSSIPECSSAAFEEHWERVQIGFHGLFAGLLALFACIAGFKFLRSKQRGKALRRWWAFGGSIILCPVGIIMYIVSIALRQCEIDGDIQTSLSGSWLLGIGELLLLGVNMLPLCRGVLRAAGKATKLVTVVHSCYLAVVTMVLIAAWVIDTYSIDIASRYSWLSDDEEILNLANKLQHHSQKLWVASLSQQAFAVLMVIAVVAFASLRGSKIQIRGFKVFVWLAITSMLATILTELGSNLNRASNLNRVYRENEGYTLVLVETFLQYFFLSCTLLFTLFAASAIDHVSDTDAAAHFAEHPAADEGAQEQKFGSVPLPQPYQLDPAPYPNAQQYPQSQLPYQFPPPQYQQRPQATHP